MDYITGVWPIEAAERLAQRADQLKRKLPKLPRLNLPERDPTPARTTIHMVSGRQGDAMCQCACHGIHRALQVKAGAFVLGASRLSRQEQVDATAALCAHILSGEFANIHDCQSLIVTAITRIGRVDVVAQQLLLAKTGLHPLCDPPHHRLRAEPARLEAIFKKMLSNDQLFSKWSEFTDRFPTF